MWVLVFLNDIYYCNFDVNEWQTHFNTIDMKWTRDLIINTIKDVCFAWQTRVNGVLESPDCKGPKKKIWKTNILVI